MNFTSIRALGETLKHVDGTIYVDPSPEFQRALNIEIQKITGWKSPDFMKGAKFSDQRTWWITSMQPDFATALQFTMEEQLSTIQGLYRGVTEIEAICYNPRWTGNEWRDQVHAGIRWR